MGIFDYVKYLGIFYGESGLRPLLEKYDFADAPKLDKGDYTTFLTKESKGFEITFKDERFIEISQKKYPEGALVVNNIRFYGLGRKKYKPYAGDIYTGINLKSKKKDVLKAFGYPNFPKYSAVGKLLSGEDDDLMRWDKEGYCFFCEFDEKENILEFSIQLPVDES